MSPEEFEGSLEFSLLTPREREFVVAFIETRDVDAATLAAHPKAQNQWALRSQMRRNQRVLAALHLWFGRPPISAKETAVADVKRDIRKLRGVARVQARRLLLQIEGVIEAKK
jgi:hypothetical protein